MEFHISHLWFWLGVLVVSGFVYVSETIPKHPSQDAVDEKAQMLTRSRL